MEARVLGPLSLSVDGVDMVPPARKQRQLLSLLLMNANRVTTVDGLMRALWDDVLPATALTTLQNYILRLRKHFDGVLGDRRGREVLKTRDGAYVLAIDETCFDLHLFRGTARAGYQALEVGDDDRAARLLREALDLWRGAALADIRPTRALEAMVRELHEARVRVLQQWLEAELRLSRFEQCLDELGIICARYPLHETFHRQYMVALYRTGQRLQALEVYRLLRERLVETTGLEPGESLLRLHEEMLRGHRLVIGVGAGARHRAAPSTQRPYAYSTIAMADTVW
ncbi:BTAD domain-containing putative transcriptional regulator [Actinosynnema sp. NPDC053489]|uniref:AfsR/SARP family transcriptional regulator n=1 Tax=Actinosynnema sp. NPDC053489 TaxID=3363916 RepID=UPI0037CA6CB4